MPLLFAAPRRVSRPSVSLQLSWGGGPPPRSVRDCTPAIETACCRRPDGTAQRRDPHGCRFRALTVHRKRVTGIRTPGDRFEQWSCSYIWSPNRLCHALFPHHFKAFLCLNTHLQDQRNTPSTQFAAPKSSEAPQPPRAASVASQYLSARHYVVDTCMTVTWECRQMWAHQPAIRPPQKPQ